MSELVRFSLSMERPLLDRLERMAKKSGYANRSEFVRDMIRDRLVQEEWAAGGEVLGTATLIYNHHARRLTGKLTDLQHHHHRVVLATTHVHLTEELCVEAVLMRGKAGHIQEVADLLRQQRGVLHVALSMSSTGKALV